MAMIRLTTSRAFQAAQPTWCRTMSKYAKGVEFDTIAREWRCKWSMDNDKASLVKAQKALKRTLKEFRWIRGIKGVQRVVCEDCLDFKVITSLSFEYYMAWKINDYEPEYDFLEQLRKIDGITEVETQSYTIMPM